MSKELQIYKCASCGKVVELVSEPFRCIYCGGGSMLLVGDDRVTRFGTTKPAKTVTK
jgi:DNA-directed RNA polymerase subunit RPC12/RpoP